MNIGFYIDVMIKTSIHCSLIGSVLGLPDCNFDDRDHWCDWVQSLDDEYQWKARQYPTFTPGTGPQADHTTASKYPKFNQKHSV